MQEELDGQVTWEDLGLWSGRTSLEPFRQEPQREKTSGSSLKKRPGSQMKMPLFLDLRTTSGHQQDASWEMDGVSLGEHMMHSSGVFLKDESGYVYSLTLMARPQERFSLNCGEKPIPVLKTKLSQILVSQTDAKYSLSAKACGGILRRAERRGKELPPILKEALIRQSVSKKEQESQTVASDVMYTLNTVEQHGVVYSIGHDERAAQFTTDEKTDPLTASDYKDPIKVLSIGNGQLNQISMNEKSNTLDTMHDQQAVLTYQDTVGALCARDYKGIGSQYVEEEKCITQSVVRRLTPLECERLQGFPDHWTDIGEWIDTKGKKHKDADGPRYKALGNSIALPFWQWLVGRIVPHIDHEPTMASLFDGIGGFPLVFNRAGCNPVWASEIEEFPIAVTKMRFHETEGRKDDETD